MWLISVNGLSSLFNPVTEMTRGEIVKPSQQDIFFADMPMPIQLPESSIHLTLRGAGDVRALSPYGAASSCSFEYAHICRWAHCLGVWFVWSVRFARINGCIMFVTFLRDPQKA